MKAIHYRADSENGDHIDDPSEDALVMLVEKLNGADNTYMVIRPAEDDPAWCASVSTVREGCYEIIRRDGSRFEYHVTAYASVDRVARELIRWLDSRGAPRRTTKDFRRFHRREDPGTATAPVTAPRIGGR